MNYLYVFFFSSRRRHTRLQGDWSSDVCSSDLVQRPQRRLGQRDHHLGADLGRLHRQCLAAHRRGGSPRTDLVVLSSVDRKSTRLNSSHLVISYAVFCLKKKKKTDNAFLHNAAS